MAVEMTSSWDVEATQLGAWAVEQALAGSGFDFGRAKRLHGCSGGKQGWAEM